MAFESKVYRILIASPSDVYEEREITARVIQEWNDLHSFNKKIVLLPLRWETHTAPTYGERPQETINHQIVDECDIVIGFFWTRIGSPTGKDISGTVEEIKRAARNGKPVMLYFSKRAIDPSEINIEQLDKLNSFKSDLFKIALIENYNSLVEFRDKLSRQIEIKIRELQESLDKNKSINFCLISGETGNKITHGEILELERLLISNDEIKEMLDSRPDVQISTRMLVNNISILRSKYNRIPIVINIKNQDNRIYSNINVELKIQSNKEKALKLGRIRGTDNDTIADKISRDYFTDNQEKVLSKIYSSDVKKINSSEWEVQVPQFSLLPQKSKNIDPLLLLYPEDDCTITIDVRLVSDNLFEILEFNQSFDIKHSTRIFTPEEKANCVESSILEEDDLPF